MWRPIREGRRRRRYGVTMSRDDVIEDGAEAMTAGGRARSVISLASRRRIRTFGVVDDVTAYWESLRCGRVVPLRSEIDPRGIDGALDCAFIVERIAPGFARFRLAGSYLVDLMGAEVKGMPLSMLFAQGSRKRLAEAVEGVFAGPETLRMQVAAERGLGRPTVAGEMVLLPLRSDLGDVTRALGCLATEGEIGRAPRRLQIRAGERVDALTGLTPTAERPRASAAIRDALPEPEADPMRRAEPRAASARPEENAPRPVLRPVPGAPHLRVLEGGE